MKAAFFEGPGHIEVREVADPLCPPGGLLTRVEACAICGTDLRSYEFGSKHKGEIIGHETVGTVIEVGEGAEQFGFRIGDRVVDCPVTCGECRYCLSGVNNLCSQRGNIGGRAQGGFAELRPILASAVSGGFVIKIPNSFATGTAVTAASRSPAPSGSAIPNSLSAGSSAPDTPRLPTSNRQTTSGSPSAQTEAVDVPCLSVSSKSAIPGSLSAEASIVDASCLPTARIPAVSRVLSSEAATLIEPLACVLNGNEMLDFRLDSRVAIIGAGPIGALHLLLAKMRGASEVAMVDLHDERLEQMRAFGADHLINASRLDAVATVRSAFGGRGSNSRVGIEVRGTHAGDGVLGAHLGTEVRGDYVDDEVHCHTGSYAGSDADTCVHRSLEDYSGADIVIVACVSAAAQAQAVEMASKRGQVLMFAGLPESEPNVTLNANLIHYNELRLMGAKSSVKRQWDLALELIRSGRIDANKIVNASVPLDRIQEGFELAKSGKVLKVAVKP